MRSFFFGEWEGGGRGLSLKRKHELNKQHFVNILSAIQDNAGNLHM